MSVFTPEQMSAVARIAVAAVGAAQQRPHAGALFEVPAGCVTYDPRPKRKDASMPDAQLRLEALRLAAQTPHTVSVVKTAREYYAFLSGDVDVRAEVNAALDNAGVR